MGIRIAFILWLLMCPAWAQSTQAFKNFIGGLPSASSSTSADKLYILQGGQNKSINPALVGGGGSAACVTSFQYIPQAEWAAITAGTSTYDTTAALNTMLASGASCFSLNPGTYSISFSLTVPSNVVIYGNDAELKVPSAGWLLVTHTGYGVLNLFNVSNVWIHDLHIFGTTSAVDANHTPKLIFMEAVNNIHITHNFLENSGCETIWDGVALTSNDVFVEGNYFTNDAVNCPGSGGLPVVQANWNGGTVSHNDFVTVGIAIGLASRMTILGNYINGCTHFCIGAAEGSASGAVIEGNTVVVTDNLASVGCFLLDADTGNFSIVGNICTVNATHAGANIVNAIFNSSTKSNILNNTIILNGPGSAIGIHSVGVDNTTITQNYNGNVVIENNTDGTFSFCYEVSPAGATRTINATLSNNIAIGCSGGGGYAYFISASTGGTVNVALVNNTKDGGQILLNTPTGNTPYQVATGIDNDIAYSYDNLTGTPQRTNAFATQVSANSFVVGGIAGVSCTSGTVVATTMVITSGIVTHC